MLNRKKLIGAIKALSKFLGETPTSLDYVKHGKKFGFSRYQVEKEFGTVNKAAEAAGLPPCRPGIGGKSGSQKEELLRERVRELEKALELESNRASALSRFSGMAMRQPPDWLAPRSKKRGISGAPFLLISDVHFDEVVRPEEINGMNEYNRTIAVRRLERTFKMATWLCHSQFAQPRFDGIVCGLGGDMVSGNIHEELAETNQNRILRTCLDLCSYLAAGLTSLADAFGKVYVPCVAGNHGRIKKQYQFKYRAQDNFDWLIYQMLARELKHDKRIHIDARESPDIRFDIYGLRFLLTHGDQFNGGSGISGLFAPLMLGAHRKQKRQSAIDDPFDIMAMGHWHQLIQTQSLIVNGSVKGYDEYAFQHNFPPEPAQQSLVIANEYGRLTHQMPVFCDPLKSTSPREALTLW